MIPCLPPRDRLPRYGGEVARSARRGAGGPAGPDEGRVFHCRRSRVMSACSALISQRAEPLTASPEGEAQTVNKLHSCLIACVGATIGRPPTCRSNAFSGTVFCKANGHGRAMLAPTSVFRQSELPPRGGKPLAIYGSSTVNVVNSASVSKSYTFTVRLRQFSGTAAK